LEAIAVRRASPLELFRVFFRIGLFTFGGGMAMIPLIEQELCGRLCLLREDQFISSIGLAQCAPGPIAGNLAVLLGYRAGGALGAAAALAGVATPAFLVILLIASQYQSWRELAWVGRALLGLRPAVVVLIAFAALRFGRMVLRGRLSLLIYGAALTALVVLRVHPALVVVVAGLAGLGQGWLEQRERRTVGVGDDGSTC